MAHKPRSPMNSHGIEHLYIKQDKRTGRFYAQYKDRRTGKFYSFGAGNSLDSAEIKAAKQRAKDLNILIAQQVADAKTRSILDNRPAQSLITVSGWLVEYREVQQQRLDDEEIKRSTWVGRNNIVDMLDRELGVTPLAAVTVKQIKDLLKAYIKQGKSRMAQRVRTAISDVFKEAMQAGEVPVGFNPAEATKNPKAKVKRARLTLASFKTIYASAQAHCEPWVANSMMLALVTGQRRESIAAMRFADVEDGYLKVVQGKTDAHLKIGVSLTLDVVGESIDRVLKQCRDRVLSKHVIHHYRSFGVCKRGQAVHVKALSRGFAKARDLTDLKWPGFKPPSFHEIRSLAEREYRAQGVDTQALLGHKNAKMTDLYHDARGHDWVIIDAK